MGHPVSTFDQLAEELSEFWKRAGYGVLIERLTYRVVVCVSVRTTSRVYVGTACFQYFYCDVL